jgi:hypothetical protein
VFTRKSLRWTHDARRTTHTARRTTHDDAGHLAITKAHHEHSSGELKISGGDNPKIEGAQQLMVINIDVKFHDCNPSSFRAMRDTKFRDGRTYRHTYQRYIVGLIPI